MSEPSNNTPLPPIEAYSGVQRAIAYDPALPNSDRTVVQYIEVAPPAKAIWYSKTFWLNLLLLLVGIVGVAAQSELFTSYAPQLTMAAAVLNLILRFVTNTELTVSDNTRQDNSQLD